MVRASRRIRARPASSSTRWVCRSIQRVGLSRPAESRNDFGAERLGPPASNAVHARELVDGAWRRVGDLPDEAIGQQYPRLEPDALRSARAPPAERLDAPAHRARNARTWPLRPL